MDNFTAILQQTGSLSFFLFFCLSALIPTVPLILQKRQGTSVFSSFFDTYYINPNSVNIHFPEKKRNLIVVFMESWESSYLSKNDGGAFEQTLIPQFVALTKKHTSFYHTNSGGGMDIYGTSSTIGGTVAKLSGIPLSGVFKVTHEKSESFLPYAITLNDILAKEGYNQVFSYATEKEFAKTGLLFQTHGNVAFHDVNYYREKGLFTAPRYNAWGFFDYMLYDFAKNTITELAAKPEPFFYGFALVDTHMGTPVICERCEKSTSPNEQFWDVIRCADKQIASFIEWAEMQPWFANTAIVVFGDHLLPDRPGFFPETPTVERTWLNLFVNPAITATCTTNRRFSSFDMFPTILEAIGVSIEGHGLAFGRSLFSTRPTLLEELNDKVYINNELAKRSTQYEAFISEPNAAN